MVQVAAHQQPGATPVAQPAQGLSAQQKGIGVVPPHTPSRQARALQSGLQGLNILAMNLHAA